LTRRAPRAGFFRSGGLELSLAGLCALLGLAGAAVGRSNPDSPLRIALYAASYAAGGFGPVRDLVRNLLARQLDINLLMVAAALGSAALGHWGEGAVLLFLFSLSGALERVTMERTARSIESLVTLRPETAVVVRGGVETRADVVTIEVGETVRALPGEHFAVDGVILEGTSAADESTLTGEAEPVEKEPGARVFAGTVNLRGAPLIRVLKRPEETTLSRIVQSVREASRTKSTTERFVDRWQRPYVISVFAGAALAGTLPYVTLGIPFGEALYRALVLLVAASPCAVVIATPAAMLSAITHAAHHGVLFKGSIHLERLADVSAIAVDKTGTITHGKPRVVAVAGKGGWEHGPAAGSENGTELLRLAASMEARSEHHHGRAVVAEASRRGIALQPVTEFESHAGQGVHGHVQGQWVGVGRESLFERHDAPLPSDAVPLLSSWRDKGHTALLVIARRDGGDGAGGANGGDGGAGGRLWGAIAVADTVRPRARAALAACRKLGIRHIALLTGDHEGVARGIGREIEADEVRAGLHPEQKVSAVRELAARWGGLAMVGDGVNDAPALATATVGIAMGGAGTDVALDTADVVLMRDDLEGIPFSLWLAREARRVVTQSLSLAFGVIGVLVITTLGGVLPLWLAVVCHEGSTLLVIANGVRLLRVRHPEFQLP